MTYNEDPIMNQNKGYAKQEKHDLMHDNPVAKDASGGRGGSWMSKHSRSKIGGGSPLYDKGDPGHKKKFNYGDGKDNERKKAHLKKVKHGRNNEHSRFVGENNRKS